MAKSNAKPKDDLIEEPGQGHNSFSAEYLTQTLTQIEALIEERKSLNLDIKAYMDAAAEKGLDKRTLREMLRLRGLDEDTRKEREELRDMYLVALGLV